MISASAADWFEGDDAENVGQVAEAGKDEEQRVESFRTLAAIIQQQLRYAAPEV